MKKVKCTKKAKKLLKESIKVWEDEHVELVLALGEKYIVSSECGTLVIVNGVVITHHESDKCPLCIEYFCGYNCPIGSDSGKYCNGTPYRALITINEQYAGEVVSVEHIKAHLAMITYMKDLYKRCVV